MRSVAALSFLLALFCSLAPRAQARSRSAPVNFRRVVIVKIDGLNARLLYQTMRRSNPETGKPLLPWFSQVFDQHGTVFENFYVRGISLSAPSWSMLDTGMHTVIRGNAEFDRYTGEVYDYLNVFPFYLGYASNRAVDMPAVEVLDRAGIPLLIDRFTYEQTLQSFQLFQRGVSWTTLKKALVRSFSGKALTSLVESAVPLSLSSSLATQVESELKEGLHGRQFLYLDLFTGDADHEGHASSDPAALLHVLAQLDALIGRISTAIRQSDLADETLLAVVSDHGMNNVPGVISQTYNLPDLFNSPAGGAHHVVTDREQLSDYKLKGINPLVHRVITPSRQSFYLADQSSRYPTAWLDIDGNERAGVYLRNSDLNKIHILLLELAKPDLALPLRQAAAAALAEAVQKHRTSWENETQELTAELAELSQAIAARKEMVAGLPKKDIKQHEIGQDKVNRRLRLELQEWQRERTGYQSYLDHLNRLLRFSPDREKPLRDRIGDLVPEMALGDSNSLADLTHYVVGLSPAGLMLTPEGRLDEQKSFRTVDYFALLANQRARNNPQPGLSPNPVDFTAMTLTGGLYRIYKNAASQLLLRTRDDGQLSLVPVRDVSQSADGQIHWVAQPWCSGLPLELFEDPQLHVPAVERAAWLSSWHTEREWLVATHETRYSNAVIGLTEELSPVGRNVPGRSGISSVLLRYERRRRELVQPDFHVFAADHWNFNARFPNPGGNHGSFFRISTHSVWMMAGRGIPATHLEEPYDSLSFGSTILHLLGRTPPMPGRVVAGF